MPYWSVIVASIAALLLTIVAAELWLRRSQHTDLTNALAATLHFLIDGLSAFGVTGMVTQVHAAARRPLVALRLFESTSWSAVSPC